VFVFVFVLVFGAISHSFFTGLDTAKRQLDNALFNPGAPLNGAGGMSRPPKPPNTKIESEDWENIRFVDADKEGERERDNMTYTCRRRTDKRVMSTGGRRNRLATASTNWGTGACVGGGGGGSGRGGRARAWKTRLRAFMMEMHSEKICV
jgi:hypothetical protein